METDNEGFEVRPWDWFFRTFGEKGLAPRGSAPEIPGKRGKPILLALLSGIEKMIKSNL
jgi:hypothetical protein